MSSPLATKINAISTSLAQENKIIYNNKYTIESHKPHAATIKSNIILYKSEIKIF